MKAILIIVLLISVSDCFNKADNLSTESALSALQILDEIQVTTDFKQFSLLRQKFTDLTDLTPALEARQYLYTVIEKNNNRTSLFAKMSGLLSFKTWLLIGMVIVTIALMFVCMYDIILFLSIYFGIFFYKLFLTRRAIRIEGLVFGICTICFKYENLNSQILKNIFYLENMYPLLGCVVIFVVVNDYFSELLSKITQRNAQLTNTLELIVFKDLVLTIIFCLVAVFHNNHMVGILTVMHIFYAFGFSFGGTYFGYYVGFSNTTALTKCIVLAIMMNGLMLLHKFTNSNLTYVKVFEPGVFFWASFVGCLSLLLMSSIEFSTRTNISFEIRQLILMYTYMMMSYLGNVYDLETYRSIGGTFMVFAILDMQRMIFIRNKIQSWKYILTIVLVNMYVIKYMITYYPEYCIF